MYWNIRSEVNYSLGQNDPFTYFAGFDMSNPLVINDLKDLVQPQERRAGLLACRDKEELQKRYAASVAELTILLNQQMLAVINYPDSESFDDLISEVNDRRLRTRDAFIRHIEAHGC